MTEKLVASGGVDLVVVDSVAALVPRAELAGEMGDQQMGLQARLMSQPSESSPVLHTKAEPVSFSSINFVKKSGPFGSGEDHRRKRGYYASLRLDVRRIGAIKDGQEAIGNRTRVRIVRTNWLLFDRLNRYPVRIICTEATFSTWHQYGVLNKAE